VAGLVGVGALALGGFGLAALPARWWAVVLIGLAMFAFAVDVQTGVPRLYTGLGTFLFTLGSLTLYEGFDLSWIALLAGIGGVLLVTLVGMPSMVRTRFATPTIGRGWMIGELGDAVTDIDPDGIVLIRDAKWRARTNRATPIEAGGRLRVVALEGTVLEVEPEAGGARDHRERRHKAGSDG
jgi:membrane-bound serine protease (ClpP class)